MNRFKLITTLGLATALALAGCARDEYGNQRPMTDTEKGVLIGAAAGAALGLATGNHKAKRALIGAVGGGLAGGVVGSYMDKQKQDLEKVLAPEIASRAIAIDKLPDNLLKVTMTSQTAFQVNSSQVNPGFYSTMDKISGVINRYGKTHLTIVGHTDSTGSAKYNQTLSEHRAQSVQDYFLGKGVIAQRLQYVGKGESEPRASNNTPQGRELNRRVEIIITPVVADS
jgi:outer membrane protein OmpA-like peptidoglycan-associated protein